MQFKNYNVYFFFAVLIGVSVLAYFIVKPFLVPFLIAAILGHFFSPVYRFLKKYFRSAGLSSAASCLLILLIIILPIIGILSLVANEIQGVLNNFSQNPEAVKKVVSNLLVSLAGLPFFDFVELDKLTSQENIISAVRSFSQNALTFLQGTYRGVVHFVYVTFIMFFSLFYLFIDGGKLVKKIMRLSPLQDKYESILIEKFNSITRATIKGTTLIAIVQGFLGAVLFTATGVASPVLFGILMTVSSVIPSVGSGLVWLPVGIAMLLLGHTVEGIIIILIGALVIGTIDNVLRPKLVGRDTQMHPLLILFSTLGGITLFGIAGFFIGPIMISLFVALWDIYALEFKSQLEKFNN